MTLRARVVLLVVGLAGCGGPTEIVAAVRTDLPPVRQSRIEIAVERLDGSTLHSSCTCVEGDGCTAPPQTLGIAPAAPTSQRFRVVARGFAGADCAGAPLVAQSATVRFQEGSRLLLELGLYDACVGVVCDPGFTCDPGSRTCVSDERPVLPPLDGADLAAPPADLADLGQTAPFRLAVPSGGAFQQPVVVALGGRYHVAWLQVAGGSWGIDHALVDANGAVTPLPPAASGSNPLAAPELAAPAGTTSGVLTYLETVGATTYSRIALVEPTTGATSTQSPLVANAAGSPRVFTDGTSVWLTNYQPASTLNVVRIAGGVTTPFQIEGMLSGNVARVSGPGPTVVYLDVGGLSVATFDGMAFTATALPGALASPSFAVATGPSGPVALWLAGTTIASERVGASAPTPIVFTMGVAGDPDLAGSASGLTAVWVDTMRTLWVASLDGQGSPLSIDPVATGTFFNPRVARLGSGALVVWDDGAGTIWGLLR